MPPATVGVAAAEAAEGGATVVGAGSAECWRLTHLE